MKSVILAILAMAFIFPARSVASCYVLGDSIAVGTASRLPECGHDAQVGLNTRQAVSRFVVVPNVDLIVVSLGANDGWLHQETVSNLRVVRARLHAKKVVWILPVDGTDKTNVKTVAKEYGDDVLDVDKVVSRDHVHPTPDGYTWISSAVFHAPKVS
jgi:lysophospholipase L1-like esterase